MNIYSAVLYCALVCVACTHSRALSQDDRCRARPGEVFGSTADSLLGGVPVSSGAHGVHTERMLQPDPAVRTYDHLYGLRNMIRRFREAHGRLPDAMEDVLPPSTQGIKWNSTAGGVPSGIIG